MANHRFVLVTHAPRGAHIGNRVTALRWAKFLRVAGAHVQIISPTQVQAYHGPAVNVVVFLHARRCAPIQRILCGQPTHVLAQAKWVNALTGTDIYGGWPDADEQVWSLQHIAAIIALQTDMHARLPPRLQARTHVIMQSAVVAPAYSRDDAHGLRVLVSGHLRREKDPFAGVQAMHEKLPNAAIQLRHCGGEIEAGMVQQALRWQQCESRYHYLGELPRAQALEELRRADLLINASLQEGGPAVVTEAIVAGVPVLASAIPAHIALLGNDYAGLFTVSDRSALAQLLHRAQTEMDFRQRLRQQLQARAPLFAPAHEAQLFIQLMQSLLNDSHPISHRSEHV